MIPPTQVVCGNTAYLARSRKELVRLLYDAADLDDFSAMDENLLADVYEAGQWWDSINDAGPTALRSIIRKKIPDLLVRNEFGLYALERNRERFLKFWSPWSLLEAGDALTSYANSFSHVHSPKLPLPWRWRAVLCYLSTTALESPAQRSTCKVNTVVYHRDGRHLRDALRGAESIPRVGLRVYGERKNPHLVVHHPFPRSILWALWTLQLYREECPEFVVRVIEVVDGACTLAESPGTGQLLDWASVAREWERLVSGHGTVFVTGSAGTVGAVLSALGVS